MIRKGSPEPVEPYYVGSRPYPDSEESEDDVLYEEEDENELQQINLRNEETNQITVDTCGDRCAQLDDFNWFLPTDEWNEKSDNPESEIDTLYSGNGVHVNASDLSSPELETTTQRLSSPPVVAQRRRRNVRTADNTLAMDTRQESVAPSTFDSERIHQMPECITKGGPKLEAAPPASRGMAQPNCSDCSRTDPLPLESGRLGPAGYDTPAGKPPAEMNICNNSDNLQIEMSATLVKMADGSPPAEVNILTDSDTLQTALSVMTVMSERWMERFIMNPLV